MAMTNAIVTWVLWMDLNGIRAFSKLTPSDLSAYIEKAVYGTGNLLEFTVRIRKHLSALKTSGSGLPMKHKVLDSRRIFDEGLIDGQRACHDPASQYEILKAAQEEGLYLTLTQRRLLKAGSVTPSRISQNHLFRLLQPWEYQWQMRRTLPGDKLTFDPFPSEGIAKTVFKLGVAPGRTKTIPSPQAMFLIDRSIRWVLDYSPSILNMIKQSDEVALGNKLTRQRRRKLRKLEEVLTDLQSPEGPGQPWPVRPRIIGPSDNKSLGIASTRRCLFASCFVVIAAFTARRLQEVTSCGERGTDNDYCISSNDEGYWIELWIEKTVQRWDKTPCPEVVVKAVEVLRKLSERARIINAKPDLFQYKSFGSNKTASFRVRKGLAELTNHLDIPPLDDGSSWEFTSHQLRRFFAIMYMWRYEFGELSALSYQLRHYNLDMTRRYITEPTQGKIFREVQTEHTVSILKEVALGRRDGSGPFGERFKKMAQKIRSQLISTVHVFTEEKFAERIERLILRSGKVLKGFPWGYCTCGSSSRDLGQAKCLNGADAAEARGPDKAKATLLTCANCPHHFTHEAFRPYATTQIEFHEKASQDKTNGHLVRNASATFSKQLREYVNRFFKRSATVRSQDAQENKKPSPSNRTSKPKRRSSKDQRKDCSPSKVLEKRSA
jgi:integrase